MDKRIKSGRPKGLDDIIRNNDRWILTFDLFQEKLRRYYPKLKNLEDPYFYLEAYNDIGKILKEYGFEHKEGSVYLSENKMTGGKCTK